MPICKYDIFQTSRKFAHSKYLYIYKSMTEISKIEPQSQCFLQQTIQQQQALIQVLKQEIIRLQLYIIDVEKQRDQKDQMYRDMLDENQNLKEKIQAIKENNQSIMQTFNVFQREFVKRDYKMGVMSQKKIDKDNNDGPFFMELIRNMKQKFRQSTFTQPLKIQKSYLSQYYGFYLNEENCQIEAPPTLTIPKLKSLGRKNFFPEPHRHLFWFQLCPNSLSITQKHFSLLCSSLNSENTPPLLSRSPSSLIDLDLRRMDLKLDPPYSNSTKQQIKKCLQLFALYRPDVGYVQGMSYLAWMFTIRMAQYEAFVCFSNLIIGDEFVRELYFFRGDGIKRIIGFFQECLGDKKPKLRMHMQKLGVESELFIIEWAYTMFSRAFSLRIIGKIWDLWFCEDYNVFFKVTMVIMEMLQAQILQQNQNDKIVQMLRTRTHKLDQIQFLKNLQKQKLFQDLKL